MQVLASILIAFVVWRLVARGRCGYGRHRMYTWGGRHHCGVIVMGDLEQLRRHRGARERPPAPTVELSPEQKKEQAVSDLRRRYVDDEITVEEYEEGLDRILKSD